MTIVEGVEDEWVPEHVPPPPLCHPERAWPLAKPAAGRVEGPCVLHPSSSRSGVKAAGSPTGAGGVAHHSAAHLGERVGHDVNFFRAMERKRWSGAIDCR